ncbi:CPBP family glutamic-type intramembrane protease [Flavobacterium sp.]|uniref:CPBP family glutamic-type intramembrane protease n=1 Tax=Flavobacterium sp. TaxID=239 RepID=UPI00345D5508
MLRIFEIFIPFNFFWRTLIFYYLLFFLANFYLFKFKINPGYTKKFIFLLPLGILFGISTGFLGNYFFEITKNSSLLFIFPIMVFAEELLFRGLIQNLIKKSYGRFLAIIFAALIYGIFCMGFGFKIAVFFFAINFMICLVYDFSENIFLTFVINLIFNLFLFVLI